jgi:hypothetical protein
MKYFHIIIAIVLGIGASPLLHETNKAIMGEDVDMNDSHIIYLMN